MSPKHEHTNKLIHETSPYLLQHAHNPVDWFPWGEEALAKAKEENKPIFLSIGYAACHWCHVMERESFEKEEIAKILNSHFVSIKVDREERPDLDDIYMTAVIALSGSGGWPMTVFLTPDLKPFYGGTYFPPEDKWGRVGFKNLLLRLADFWHDEKSRAKIFQDAETLSQIIARRASQSFPVDEKSQISTSLLVNAARQLEASFDGKWGGFNDAPKFPPSHALLFLFRHFHRTGNKRSLEMAKLTLDRMSEGGIYDHLAGGFHRYSVDSHWLVPHFEKMLYDNAQLAVVYTEAFQVTGIPQYARVAQEIFEYEMTTMTDSTGGIYSTEDADSQGKEGLFYLWKWDEIQNILGKNDTAIVSRYYCVKKEGNFPSQEEYHKGQNILHRRQRAASVAKELDMTESELEKRMSAIKKNLLKERDKRIRPGLDNKIITSWNALMISAYARGHQVFADTKYLAAGERAASFIMNNMRTKEGKLLRTHRDGESKFFGYLEDYAYTIRSFVDLYEAGFDSQWLFAAEDLLEEMLAQFWEDKSASLYNTSRYHENLIVRAKTTNDSAMPSPIGVAINSLLRLGKILDREDYAQKAQRILRANHPLLEKAPQGHLGLLMNVDPLIYPAKEIVIIGAKEAAQTKELLKEIHRRFLPHRVIVLLDPASEEADELTKKIPLVVGRKLIDGKAAAYVCENFSCQLPAASPEQLAEQLIKK
jgi:uncharacterized protein YyaL (SSP411 family)